MLINVSLPEPLSSEAVFGIEAYHVNRRVPIGARHPSGKRTTLHVHVEVADPDQRVRSTKAQILGPLVPAAHAETLGIADRQCRNDLVLIHHRTVIGDSSA